MSTGSRNATGCAGPGPADVDADVEHPGLLLLGRELVGDRPARRPRHRPQLGLDLPQVDLDHHPVGLVVEVVAGVPPVVQVGGDLVPAHLPAVGVDPEAHLPEQGQDLGLGAGRTGRVQLVHEGLQAPARGDRGVELAHRPRRGVARVGVGLLAVLLELLVEGREARLGHVHLAAHLELARHAVGDAAETDRHRADGAHVGGDVLALDTVAAGRPGDQLAVPVGERHRQAVDLQLADEAVDVGHDPLDAPAEGLDLLHREGVGRGRAWGCGDGTWRRPPRGRRRPAGWANPPSAAPGTASPGRAAPGTAGRTRRR